MTTIAPSIQHARPRDTPLTRARLARVVRPTGVLDAFSIDLSGDGLPSRFHDDYVVCVVRDGEAQLSLPGTTHRLDEHSVLVLGPGTVYSLAARAPRRCSMLMLHCSAAVAQAVGLPPGRGAEPAGSRVALRRHAALAARLRAAFARTVAPTSDEPRCASLRAALCVPSAWTVAGCAATPSDAVRSVRQLLDSRFASPLRIGRIAAETPLSVFQLIRLFSREIGLPPHAYLRQVRVNQALTMIRAGEPITSAAYHCGFADQSHLTRAFKQLVGVPPGAYARAGREIGASSVARTG